MGLTAYLKRLRVQMFGGVVGVEDIERLKKRGLVLGKNVHIMEGVVFDSSHCWLIRIGQDVTIAPSVHILAHDASTKRDLGYAKIGCVSIGDHTFIGARSVILPGVRIGSNVIVGAGSVVSKDIPDGSVAVGNPAKVVMPVSEYLARQKELMKSRPVFDRKWTVSGGITDDMKRLMREKLGDGIGYVQ